MRDRKATAGLNLILSRAYLFYVVHVLKHPPSPPAGQVCYARTAGWPRMKSVGPYEILEVLDDGPRPLYRARAPDGRLVALKTIPSPALAPEIRERFLRRAAIGGTLAHPNWVRIHDAGEANGVFYQAMELLEGCDLGQVIAERRPLTWVQKLSIMEQVCQGLQYAHARSLVHGEIRPANLFVEKSGRVRILDFGMARGEASSYRAPEQAGGEPATPASDIFSAGVVFYELAAGKHPYVEAQAAPVPLREAAPGAPEDLDLVLYKAIEKAPSERLQSAEFFHQALWFCKANLERPPAGEMDPRKTVVMPRQAGPAPAAPRPAAPPLPPPKPAGKLDLSFCPSCTHGNPKGALTCARCGQPLVAVRLPAPETEPAAQNWVRNAGLLVAALLVLLMILIAISKN